MQLSVPKVGVNITGDDSGNKIWGTTNFADRISAGFGDDTHYMHKGDDYSFDAGGTNTYIVPIGILGNKIIDDATRTGFIWLESEKFDGVAIPILNSSCPIVSVGAYSLNLGKVGSYYLIEQGSDLLVTPDCATTILELQNTLTLKNFAWGDFGINKDLNNDTSVTIGSNGDDNIDCSLFSRCFASSFAGSDLLIAKIGQNAILFGYDFGSKVFKILSDQSNNRRLQTSENTSLKIIGIKEGDIIDVTAFANLTNTNTSFIQNGTHMQMDLGGGNMITAEITLG